MYTYTYIAFYSHTHTHTYSLQYIGVTLDANWRWINDIGTYSNCYDGTTWDKTLCPDPKTCTKNCGLEGVPQADWAFPYGIASDGKDLTLDFVVKQKTGAGIANVGSRTYMMDGDDKYKMFKLKNREFTFDVDASKLPCGVNGALYFVEMQVLFCVRSFTIPT